MAMRTSSYFAIASAAFARPLSRISSILTLTSRSASSFSASSSSRRQPRHNDAILICCGNAPFRVHERMILSSFSSFQIHDMSNKQNWNPRRHHSTISGYPRTSLSLAYPSTSSSGKQRQRNIIHSTTRLFGSNPDSPYATPGHILLSDDRDDTSTIPINLSALERTIKTTREIIGYPTYDVTLSLVDEEYMKEINQATRGIDATTDVLSFCFQEHFDEPGKLGKVQFDIGDYYNLGDMLIDVEYVRKKCEADKKLHEEEKRGPIYGDGNDGGMIEGEVLSEQLESEQTQQKEDEDGDSDGEYEYEYIEVEVDEWDDRGVAPAMQYIYNPEVRIHMLIVHGMLHLVGYDHIEDDDYELMVEREDEVLAELRKRLGDDFGVTNVLPEDK